jgi:hypothetical protein
MKQKNVDLPSGRVLVVYDDVFSYQERTDMFDFVRHSLYRTTGTDSTIDRKTNFQIYSSYSEDDLCGLGIEKFENYRIIAEQHNFAKRKLDQIRVNLSYPMEENAPHSDSYGLTFLYYVNLDWEISWGGHTLFLNDQLDELEYVCLYKPNRVVVFDGTIPHMILNPNGQAPMHRYSFVIQFKEEEEA